MDDEKKGKDKWRIKRVVLGEVKMRITRRVFLTLGWIMMGALTYVLLFFSDSEKIIPTVVLVSLFILLSLEYIREGFHKKKP